MRSIRVLVASIIVALSSSACSALSGEDDGEITVAAAFYPLAFVSERVAADTGTEVEILTQPGKEPHDLELTIRETSVIADADVVVLEAGFQPAVDDAVEQNATGTVVDAAEVVDLIPIAEDEHSEEEHADEEQAEEHDHGDLDPHFWLDPVRMGDLATAVASELSEVDPDNAATYEANADELRRELAELDAAWTDGLADCERDTIVASHDAFGYLEKYDVHVAPIVGLSPDAEPTAAALAELQELIETEGITTVFSEPLEPALGDQLAADLGLSNAVLDPIEGLASANDTESDYLSLMESNLAAVQQANGCR